MASSSTSPPGAPPAKAPILAPGLRSAYARGALIVLALIYYAALFRNFPDVRALHAIRYFTETTALFPHADRIAQEYRLEAWVCAQKRWDLLDPRPYFPLRPDDKESRFQRLGYFYNRSRPVMQALDDYIRRRHDDELADGRLDGVAGRIGGIRLVRVARALPEPGAPVARYVFSPRAPIPDAERRDLYYTPASVRGSRCTSP